MSNQNKVELVAPIVVQQEADELLKEKANVLLFPETKQGDLQYLRSILVSAGTNLNGAHFLPSEMMLAASTVSNKAIDIEHDELKIVGHIYDNAYLFKNGDMFDPNKLMADYKETSQNPDAADIDIAVAGVLYKTRFPDLAEEVARGEWKVSMECFFRDFDLKIGNQIITRNEAQSLGYNPEDLVKGFIKVVAGKKVLGHQMLARVLRGITFSGMGLVKKPANPHSIVLETASHRQLMENSNLVIDLEAIDNLRGRQIVVNTESAKALDTQNKVADNLVSVQPTLGDSTASQEQIYIELDKQTGGIKRIISAGGEESAALRFTGPGIPGPGSVRSFPDELCKSFKKRHTKFNALDQSEAVVLHEHYCALFEEPCPVIGASAKAPECLRNQRNQLTRAPVDTTITKTIREHVDAAPSNTFTTVLQSEESSTTEERQEQISRIKSTTLQLRNSLREYIVAAEKKTSK